MSAAPKSAAPRAPLKNFFILPVQSFTEELGERISAARRACRLTQEEIAQKSRTSLSTYKRIEQGDTTVSIGTVFSVLYCLDNLESCEGILSDVTAVLHDETRLPQRVRHRKSPDGQIQKEDGCGEKGLQGLAPAQSQEQGRSRPSGSKLTRHSQPSGSFQKRMTRSILIVLV